MDFSNTQFAAPPQQSKSHSLIAALLAQSQQQAAQSQQNVQQQQQGNVNNLSSALRNANNLYQALTTNGADYMAGANLGGAGSALAGSALFGAGDAAAYGGGIASAGLPGIFPGATVAMDLGGAGAGGALGAGGAGAAELGGAGALGMAGAAVTLPLLLGFGLDALFPGPSISDTWNTRLGRGLSAEGMDDPYSAGGNTLWASTVLGDTNTTAQQKQDFLNQIIGSGGAVGFNKYLGTGADYYKSLDPSLFDNSHPSNMLGYGLDQNTFKGVTNMLQQYINDPTLWSAAKDYVPPKWERNW